MDAKDLETRFTFHPVTDELQVERYKKVRSVAGAFAGLLNAICPDGRELSLAITHLEEVVMWANAGIARKSPGPAERTGPLPLDGDDAE